MPEEKKKINKDNKLPLIVHDDCGRSYIAKPLSEFNDLAILPYLYSFRSTNLQRCLGLANLSAFNISNSSDLKGLYAISSLREIELKENLSEPLVIFDYVRGKTLRDYAVSQDLKQIKAYHVYEIYFDQIISCLRDFAILSGFTLCHSDINPDNIIINENRQAVLIDFTESRLMFANSVIALTDSSHPDRIRASRGYASRKLLEQQIDFAAAKASEDYTAILELDKVNEKSQIEKHLNPADLESLARTFLAAMLKKPGNTLTGGDISLQLSRVQPSFSYKLLCALTATM